MIDEDRYKTINFGIVLDISKPKIVHGDNFCFEKTYPLLLNGKNNGLTTND